MRVYEQLHDFALPHISFVHFLRVPGASRCIILNLYPVPHVSCGRFARVLMHKRRQEWGVSERNRPPLNWRCVCDSYPTDSTPIQLLKEVAGASVFSKIGGEWAAILIALSFDWFVYVCLFPQMLIMLDCWWTKCVPKLWLQCGNVHPMGASKWDSWYVKFEDFWMHHNHRTTTRYICSLDLFGMLKIWSLLTFDQLYVFFMFSLYPCSEITVFVAINIQDPFLDTSLCHVLWTMFAF